MKSLLRVSYVGALAVAAIASAGSACSSSTNNAAGGFADGGSGGEAGGGDSGLANSGGEITITQDDQIAGTTSFSVNAAFTTYSGGTDAGRPAPNTTTLGACTAYVILKADAGSAPKPVSALNAGAITIAGAGVPSSVMLTYGVVAGTNGLSNYLEQDGDTAFFAGGDMLTLSGLGGPDLPAFGPQTLIAPAPSTITAPQCGVNGIGTCPDVDRTMDLPVAWTGGGAGVMVVTLETVADARVVSLTCKFPRGAGKGVVPTALLGLLDKAGDPNTSGAISFAATSESNFMVGQTPTQFTMQWVTAGSLLTISK
jgi:hypothetical protein